MKKLVSPRKNLSAPLTASLRVGVEQAKADIWAVRASDEPYNRRNALVVSSHAELPKLLIPEAFKNTDLYSIDWKGEPLTKQRCNDEILKPLAQGAKIKTACVFDVEQMDAAKTEMIAYCLDNMPLSSALVLSTSEPISCSILKHRPTVVLDCTLRSEDPQYAAESIRFFRETFKQASEITLSDFFFAETKAFITTLSPDAVTHLLDALWYCYVEARFAGVYLNTDEFRLTLFHQAMQRVRFLAVTPVKEPA